MKHRSFIYRLAMQRGEYGQDRRRGEGKERKYTEERGRKGTEGRGR